jgi:uncharacterized protein (DUF2237 family)
MKTWPASPLPSGVIPDDVGLNGFMMTGDRGCYVSDRAMSMSLPVRRPLKHFDCLDRSVRRCLCLARFVYAFDKVLVDALSDGVNDCVSGSH